jgi:hypothetical protein
LGTTASTYWGLGRNSANGRFHIIEDSGDEFLTILTSGNVGISTTNPLTALHVVKQDESTMFLDAYSNTNYAPGVVGRRARGTVALPAVPQSGDFLTGIFGRGYNSAAFTSASNGLIGVCAGETWEVGKNGTYIVFETTPNASTTRTEKLRITGDGNINLPIDSQLLQFGAGQDATISYDGTNMIINPKLVGTGYLSVTGNINANANDIYTTGAVKGVHKAADGTAAVADGTYTMGLGGTTNGTITIKDGIITAVQQCVA